MAAHADADHRDLDDVVVGHELLEADRGSAVLERLHGAVESALHDGELHVGRAAVRGDVLDDHVDVDVAVGQRPEDRRRHARLVGDLGSVIFASSRL